MKRNLIALTITVFTIALVPGCEKGDGYIINHGPAELNNCQIVQIIRDNFGPIDTVVFAYNNWGNPVSVIKLPKPFYMSGYNGPNYAFTYDKKHRLAEFIAMTPDETQPGGIRILLRRKYFYDNPGNDNITRDSGYHEPTLANFLSLTYYTYDKYGRVIKDSTLANYAPAPLVNTYSYNSNGNRASVTYDSHTGNVYTTTFGTYDNKTNILRTNKIWMFLSCDYSVNNPFVGVSYNSRGLPTQLNLFDKGAYGGNSQLRLCLDTYYDEAQITYACK